MRLRTGSAHAWCQIYLPGSGGVEFGAIAVHGRELPDPLTSLTLAVGSRPDSTVVRCDCRSLAICSQHGQCDLAISDVVVDATGGDIFAGLVDLDVFDQAILPQFGDPRLHPVARLLSAPRGAGQGVDEESYERGEQDDRGCRRGGVEERLKQVGQPFDQAGERGHERGHG